MTVYIWLLVNMIPPRILLCVGCCVYQQNCLCILNFCNWEGWKTNGEFGHICIFLDIEWEDSTCSQGSFRSGRMSKSCFHYTQYQFLFSPGTPSPPEILLTSSDDTPYPLSILPGPYVQNFKLISSKTQMWPNSPFFPNPLDWYFGCVLAGS